MQLEPVKKFKEVGKKKIIAGATAGFLLIGGGATFASESGQDAVKGAIDSAISKAVAYYVKNIDSNLSKYAQEQRGTIKGSIASSVNSYAQAFQKHYEKELARGKAEIASHQQKEVQDKLNYANEKYSEAEQKITQRVNEDVAKENATTDKAVADEIGSINASIPNQ